LLPRAQIVKLAKKLRRSQFVPRRSIGAQGGEVRRVIKDLKER
jgi:hypothetical protein